MSKSKIEPLLSTGEVVLIETQQHWMAALRFALRPILIALGAVALVAINNWLGFSEDSALSFINDLISWAAAILIIVSVIWLPIDLVRWDTRRYALTNRRAIRTEGLFRKSTFDSSLEQINDIAIVESAIGRMLHYADLTLYTASDTANETYEQLRDGQQFKKAVLDAKEGARTGQPLTALPDGFLVKGGTNEASMRADGKTELADAKFGHAPTVDEPAEPAAATPPPAPAPAVAPPPPPEPAAPAPAPAAAAPVPPPAAPPAPEPEPEPTEAPAYAPEPIVEPALVAEPEPVETPEPEVEPEPIAEAPEEPASAVSNDTDTTEKKSSGGGPTSV